MSTLKVTFMPVKKRQFAAWCIMPILAAILFSYGALFNARPVYPKDKIQSVPQSEPSLIKEVTVGGVALDELGQLRKTYSGKPLDFCPT
jgi:hypothetical protein